MNQSSLLLTLLLSAAILSGCSDGGSSMSSGSTPEQAFSRPQDPLLPWQWHLYNTGQNLNGLRPLAGADLNIWPLWNRCPATGCAGEGILVAVVDDGLEIRHPDLQANISPLAHRNFMRPASRANQDPSPTDPDDAHGTAVAGLIAARDNQIGGVGVAPRAQLLGINLLAIDFTTAHAAEAMLHRMQAVAVSNNSWGAPDGTGFISPSNGPWRQAIEQGITQGYEGRGIAYIWAGGNGHDQMGEYFYDYSNLDGQASFHGVLAVGALNAEDRRSSYSEQGSNLLISGFGGEFCNGLAITTTDLTQRNWGYNPPQIDFVDDLPDPHYTRCFNGTSSAAPTVAGVVALMRQANTQLSWRDLRWLLAHHARQNDPQHPGWMTNGAGLMFNPEYGFGAADASASVEAARQHPPLPAYQHLTRTGPGSQTMPAQQIFTSTLDLQTQLALEFVDLTIQVNGLPANQDTGELSLSLISPSGTRSLLLPKRRCHFFDEDDNTVPTACEDQLNFTFGSVQFLGEDAQGQWQLEVDARGMSQPITLNQWQLTFYGHTPSAAL